ncbi:hypothetical protein Leryth_023582 [Lithospermum erythrorhizon]|nr:hypothetical protein Leryth_023582 [Lithospermum erythrorhizon]
MGVEDGERVINGSQEIELVLKDHHCVPWNTSGYYTHNNCCPTLNYTCMHERSRINQVIKLVAVHTWVFNMAKEESMLAAYGAPPLNPVHPIHSRPAPASIIIYENVCHKGTKSIHALKFILPKSAPPIKIGVIAANEN